MIFSYNWLQSFFRKKLPKPEKLAELLTLHFFETPEIKKLGSDWVLDIDVLPSRASDCFSHIGIAREIAAILGFELQVPICQPKEDKKLSSKGFVSVSVKGQGTCLRYIARVVDNVKVGSSPKWIQERLRACGLKPINNIVDVANFVMLESGQPLHAFDLSKLEGKKIVVRFAKNKEKIVTLDDEKYELDDDILVIADSKKPVAIAGIKGGQSPEIGKSTRTVVLEAANFDARTVRRGSQKLNLKTDASWRFEHGIDLSLAESAITRAAYLIQKTAGGKVAKGLIDHYPKKPQSRKIRLKSEYVKRLLGVKISEVKIKSILKSLGFKSVKKGSGFLEVKVPSWRLDVSLAEDLIEEIGRIYGYQKVPAVFPEVSLVPPKRNLEIFWENMTKDILKEAGFIEVFNYSFISEGCARLLGYDKKELVELENPISAEQRYLRPGLIVNLLRNVRKNLNNFETIKIFELGKIFKKPKRKSQKDIIEKRIIAGLITGDEFYRLKGVVDTLLRKLGITDAWYDSFKATPENSKPCLWHAKKCAEVKIGDQEIGFLGEISPKITERLKIKKKIVVFVFDFDLLQKLCSEEHEYVPLSRFPAAIRDVAILVPKKVKVVDVLNKINLAGGLLVRDVDLFDSYEGGEIAHGKKNLAFHIVFQAKDRTLKAKEIDQLFQKIIKALEKDPGWQVRK